MALLVPQFMAPRTRPKTEPLKAKVPPNVRADIEKARRQVERGEAGMLTPEQLRRVVETGEWPDE
jgi:hypothetical protein